MLPGNMPVYESAFSKAPGYSIISRLKPKNGMLAAPIDWYWLSRCTSRPWHDPATVHDTTNPDMCPSMK